MTAAFEYKPMMSTESSNTRFATVRGSLLLQFVQVWRPDAEGSRLLAETTLRLSPGLHFLSEFRAEPQTCGQGIAGRAWQQRCATLLQEQPSQLLAEISEDCGADLTAVLAIPVFRQQNIAGVVVMGMTDGHGGAEVWSRDDRDELAVSAGHYGGLPAFEFISRHTRFPKGAGIPGSVWTTGAPVHAGNLDQDASFIRSFGNDPATITDVLGLPVDTDHGFARSVLLLLNSATNPFCDALSVLPCEAAGDPSAPVFRSDAPVRRTGSRLSLSQASNLLNRVAAAAGPVLAESRERGGAVLAIPVYRGPALHSLVCFEFFTLD